MKEEPNAKSKNAIREEGILKFWEENKIFSKTLSQSKGRKDFVFYEGPPTANAKPALHHLEARVFKDIIPRYKTMKGFHVPRKAGWDTHGLPVELQIEKKLGLQSKKDIETYGIEKFNKECKDSVFEYISDWEKFTDRIGYWVDKSSAYYTFNPQFMESVWGVIKNVDEQGLLYKDYKVLPWCPRCGTALSSHELAQGYQDDKDLSVIAKFKIIGFPDAYFLAWTTTPWTLPGNVALAVGADITYVEAKVGKEILVLAKDKLSLIQESYEVIAEHKGSEMIGMTYEPLYPFMAQKFAEKDKESFKKAYKVYGADFVNTEDGTGIVHTAVMYGQEDFELGTKIGLPKFHLVKDDGHFMDGMDFLSGRFVKDEDVAVDIIKDLANRSEGSLLFKKEKYEHSYPHCWRCKTPLIYYARDSWYIKMSSLRGELVRENEDINWEPKHIKEGRFGEWLREVKDWAISRERYWGTPLPIWVSESGEKRVIGSIDNLKKLTKKSGNKYFAMRHGESEKNAKDVLNHYMENVYHLTKDGTDMVKGKVDELKNRKIDIIITSPFHRCVETGEIIRDALDLPQDRVSTDERLWELRKGLDFEGKSLEEYHKFFSTTRERFEKSPHGGETLIDIKKRVGDFLYDLENKYKDKNILIITHKATLRSLHTVVDGLTLEQDIQAKDKDDYAYDVAEVGDLDFIPIPHNGEYELDLHKPFIDQVELVDENGGKLTRVKEVLDVWFDSGSMPFASGVSGYPADFISEAIDQTRGWFYTLHAIGVLMGKGKAYKNVICLGHILDDKGKKMSKSIGNIVDPNMMMDKYGVDALRLWMYSVNQPGDSKNFDEKTVDEVVKKVFNPLENILSFYKMYSDESYNSQGASKFESDNVLDRWIVAKLNELVEEGTKNLDNYKVFESARLIKDFVNDFSTWYVRRSRDRFKSDDIGDKNKALATTRFVLLELAKYMAPFTPFFSEYLYGELKSNSDPESVHLCDFPIGGEIEMEVLKNMEEVRRIVSLGLERRNAVNIKVRQPLLLLKVRPNKPLLSESFGDREQLINLIKDEVNVESVIFDENIKDDVELDIEITPDLKKRGEVRELIRAVQELRKDADLTPDQKIILQVETGEEGKKFIEDNKAEISKPTNISDFEFTTNNVGDEFKIGEVTFKVIVKWNKDVSR